MSEVWKDAPSFPGWQASSYGRVQPPTGGPVYGSYDGRRMTYTYRRKTYKVHQIVADAFHGVRPSGADTMHMNEDSRDNRPGNLTYGSRKENLNFPGFLAYCRSRTGDSNPYVKGRS